MQELRFVAVSEDGSYAVLAVPGRSARFTLPIDERLRAVALGHTSRLAQYEIEVESPLRPKEIQARIRAGETAEEIADAAGIPVERVRWFEGPVLAERAYIATQAQSASVRRQGDSAPGPRLGDIVTTRISALGGDPEDAEWDSRKRGDGNWQVSLTFPSGGRLHIAEWVFDPRRRHALPADESAERLSLPESELPPLTAAVPGEATVTPLAPRLGAVAAGGMTPGVSPGGYGSSAGYGNSGHGSGASRYRQDRQATDRQAHERPPAYERPAQERPSAYERPGAYSPEPPAAYAQPQAFPQRQAPAPQEPSRAPRPSHPGSHSGQPPAYTPMPGHGLVPMWEPPAWDPAPAPPPEPSAAYEPAPHEPSVAHEPAAPAPAEQVAFDEEPEPLLSGTGLDDTEFAAASVYLDTAEPVFLEPVTPEPVTVKSVTVEAAAVGPAAVAPVPAPDPEPAPAQAPSQEPAQPAKVTVAVVAGTTAAAARAAETATADEATAGAVTVSEAAAGAVATEARPAEPDPAPATGPEPAQPAAEDPAQPAAEEPARPAAEPEPAQPAAEDSARPRQPRNAKAKGRRSSVPSWDEIMLGSSRQRD